MCCAVHHSGWPCREHLSPSSSPSPSPPPSRPCSPPPSSYALYASHQHGFQEEATRQILGCVVLTRYNNRTYRVDDIVWDKNPQSTFVDSSGQPVRFLDYYK